MRDKKDNSVTGDKAKVIYKDGTRIKKISTFFDYPLSHFIIKEVLEANTKLALAFELELEEEDTEASLHLELYTKNNKISSKKNDVTIEWRNNIPFVPHLELRKQEKS